MFFEQGSCFVECVDEFADRGDGAGEEFDLDRVAAEVDDDGWGLAVADEVDAGDGVVGEVVADDDAVFAFTAVGVVVGHDASLRVV